MPGLTLSGTSDHCLETHSGVDTRHSVQATHHTTPHPDHLTVPHQRRPGDGAAIYMPPPPAGAGEHHTTDTWTPAQETLADWLELQTNREDFTITENFVSTYRG